MQAKAKEVPKQLSRRTMYSTTYEAWQPTSGLRAPGGYWMQKVRLSSFTVVPILHVLNECFDAAESDGRGARREVQANHNVHVRTEQFQAVSWGVVKANV